MDLVCGDYFRSRKYIGSKDRSKIAESVYSIMRAYARIGWWMEKHSFVERSSRSRTIVWMALQGYAEMETCFSGNKYAPTRLSNSEKEIVKDLKEKGIDHPCMPEEIVCECPLHYFHSLKNYFGMDFAAELSAMIPAAPLDLRANLQKTDIGKAQAFLEADGIKTFPTRWSPWALRCEGKPFLSRTKAFSRGWVEIQDEGSQLIALSVNPSPGIQVLDYCAGAGGKTLAIASSMAGKGRIVAMDAQGSRLNKGRQRFRKAGVADIIEVRPLSENKNRKWLRRQKGTFDAVLVDVPCSGTGTWRRNPDMRWKTYGPSLEELLNIQAEILDKVAHTVKSGGRLVYATCSLLEEENEKQVGEFLQRHPDFKVLPPAKAWPDGSPVPCEGDYMRLTPLRHETDGFFAAILTRT